MLPSLVSRFDAWQCSWQGNVVVQGKKEQLQLMKAKKCENAQRGGYWNGRPAVEAFCGQSTGPNFSSFQLLVIQSMNQILHFPPQFVTTNNLRTPIMSRISGPPSQSGPRRGGGVV